MLDEWNRARVLNEDRIQAAKALDDMPRHGTLEDKPEGTRYIMLSDTLARRLADLLRGKRTPEPKVCVLCGEPATIPDPPAAYVCERCCERCGAL